MITWDDFEKVEIRTGTILNAEAFPEARKPAYKLTIDFGQAGIKKSSAQMTDLYSTEDLVGKQIVAVLNFAPKQIGPFISEFLCTGFYQDNGSVILAIPEREIKNGKKLG
jgi:tRNA-binding protein